MNHDNDTIGEEENASSSSRSKSSSSSTNNEGGALTTVDPQADSNDLLAQARALRAQADTLREDIDKAKIEKEQKEAAKVQRWIEDLLIRYKDDDNGIELLNTVDQVTDKIMDGRFSQEQIHRIFRNLVETTATRGRGGGGDNNDDHKCSEIVSILVDAAGKLDCLERDDNPNKRWSGRVERELRHRLFAMEWNIDLDKQDDDNDGQSDPVTKPKLLN